MAKRFLSYSPLSTRKLAALSMREEDGKTFSEIGKAFGVSVTRARQFVKEGVRIRQRYEEAEAERIESHRPGLKVYEAKVLLPLLEILKEISTLKVKNS